MSIPVKASRQNYSFTALFSKTPRILLSIVINANCRFCMVSRFGDETRILDPKSLFIENDQIQHFILVSHSKIEFYGVQKQKGKLVFSKSGLLHIWHIVSSLAQGQNVVNFHKLASS